MLVPAGSTIFSDPEAGGDTTVTVAHPIDVAGEPVRGTFDISASGLDGIVPMARDAVIDGFACSASADVKFKSGKLVSCTLRAVRTVDGIPCTGSFDRDDVLRCDLGRAYRVRGFLLPAGATWIQSGSQDANVSVGDAAPALLFSGKPISHGDLYVGKAGIRIDVGDMTYRGCLADSASVSASGDVRFKGSRCRVQAPRGSLAFAPQ